MGGLTGTSDSQGAGDPTLVSTLDTNRNTNSFLFQSWRGHYSKHIVTLEQIFRSVVEWFWHTGFKRADIQTLFCPLLLV